MTELIGRLRGAHDHTDTAPPVSMDAVIQQGDRVRRRRAILPVLVAVTGVVGTAMVGTARWTAETNRGAAAQYGMAFMERPQAARDQLPAQVLQQLPMDADDPSGALDLGSTRYLGSNGEATFYAASTDRGDVCLVTTIPRSPYFASAGCSGKDGFDDGGIETYSQFVGYRALMVDDDGAPLADVTGMKRVAANLMVSDSAEGW